MHARELIEVAIMVSQGKTQAASAVIAADRCYHDYWSNSRARLSEWHSALQSYNDYVRGGGSQLLTAFPRAEAIIHEILLSEILARVWAAESARYDHQNGSNEFEPIAHNVFLAHEDARHRTLRLLTLGTGFSADELARLNRLRSSCERWSDLLLSNYVKQMHVTHLAFDKERVLDFADEHRRAAHQRKQQWQLLAASARHAFHVHSSAPAANPQANRRIAEALAPFLGSAIGFQHQLAQQPADFETRINDITGEAQRMLDQLTLLER